MVWCFILLIVWLHMQTAPVLYRRATASLGVTCAVVYGLLLAALPLVAQLGDVIQRSS